MAPDVKISYPVPGQKILNAPKLRRAALRAFMFAGTLCVMINLCTGGRAWSLIVLASLRLAWKGIFEKVPVEDGLAARATRLLFGVCLLLLTTELVCGGRYTVIVVPILLGCTAAAWALELWIRQGTPPRMRRELERRLHR